METTAITAGSIVLGVDGSPSATRALAWATEQATLEHRPLTLLHAVGPAQTMWLDREGPDQRTWAEAVLPDAHRLLAAAHDYVARRAPHVEVTEVVRLTDPRHALLEASGGAAMLVVGSRGRGPVASLLLGSVSVAVVRHARCPAVVIRPGNPGLVRRGVLVGVDGTARSAPTLEFAYRQASLRDLPLTVMHCYWDYPAAAEGAREEHLDEARRLLAENVSGMSEKFPEVHVRTETSRGLAHDVLVRAAALMDMVVVGAHHGGALSEALTRSVVAALAEHASCAVAVVPDPADANPQPPDARQEGPRWSGSRVRR